MVASSIYSIAVTGLNAGATRANVAANNVVNQNTPGFKPADVATTTLVSERNIDGGAGVQVQVFESSEEEGVNLVKEFTRIIAAETAYKASAKLIETGQELDDALLDAVD